MSRPDDGLIHAWLDGELDAAGAARVAHLVETDPEWGAAAAEARGLIAASSRIVKALDVVPAGVIPGFSGSKASGAPVKRTMVRPWLRIAATIVLVAGVGYLASDPGTTVPAATDDAAGGPGATATRAAAPVPIATGIAAEIPGEVSPSIVPAVDRVGAGAGGERREMAKTTAAADLAAANVVAQDSIVTIGPPRRSAVVATTPDAQSRAVSPPPPAAAPAPTSLRDRAESESVAIARALRSANERADATLTGAAGAAVASQPQTAQLRPRQITDREPSALGEADASTDRVIPGCWRTRTVARSDSVLVDPRILSVVRDSLVIMLTQVPLDERSLTRSAPPRATIVRVGLTVLRGTARAADGSVVPFEAARTTCP